MGILSLILGIVGLVTSFIPIINNASFILGLLGGIFAIIALIRKKRKGWAIAGLIICVITCGVVLALQESWSDSIDTISGEKTDEILEKYIDINIGEFKVTNGEFMTETELPVTIRNKSSEKKSFSIQIEAVRADGSRITSDTIYANDLSAGQSQNFKLFEFIASDEIEDIKNSTFKILEVSMY